MENKLYDVNPMSITENALTPAPAPVERDKEDKTMSLPYLMKALLVCNDAQVENGIAELLAGVKNLELKKEPKINFITEEYPIAIIVFTGIVEQTVSEIEKISHSGSNIILIGDNIPQTLLRKSLQFAIKDFVPLETAEIELLPAIKKLVSNISAKADVAPMISVINGKGGSGASFITTSLGQIISKHSDNEIALIDADLQHGTLADSLNFKPDYFLDNALQDVNELDSLAVKSMMVNRKNLSLLPVKPYSRLQALSDPNQNNMNQLLGKLRLGYEFLIADLSRGLDNDSIPIIESSDQIIIVVQQNIVSIRESKALVQQLKQVMGISSEKLTVIVNRFSNKFSTITLEEIKSAIGVDSVFKISNDYQLANACTDLGKSFEELSGSKIIEQEFLKIIKNIIPLAINIENKDKSFWSKIIGK